MVGQSLSLGLPALVEWLITAYWDFRTSTSALGSADNVSHASGLITTVSQPLPAAVLNNRHAPPAAFLTATREIEVMRQVGGGILWVGLFVGICVAPLAFALVGTARAGQGFWTDFSVALGFVGLTLLGIQFALVARVRSVSEPFGTDAVIQFHRQIGCVGLVFVLTHVALSAQWSELVLLDVSDTPARVWFGAVGMFSLLLLVASSLWRRRLRLSYEMWQRVHAALAVVAVLAAVTHVLLVSYYVDSLWKQALWTVMSAAFLGLLVWARLLRPLRLRRRPWTVHRVLPERGTTTVLQLRPVGHPGLRFEPGQFAWFSIGRSPFHLTSHPFSFCSSAESEGQIAVAIKAAGDFTSTVRDVKPGTTVYVDGPHGVFSIDQYEGAGFCFLAGGVGVAPIVSMLGTLADRGDARPVVLFSAHRAWDSVPLRDEVEALPRRLDLRVVHVLYQPPPEWTGETGYITAEVLRRHLPSRYDRFQFFICGPNPMLDAMEDLLNQLGVPLDRIHTERFAWV